ncbi:MAG: hypothetical protein D6799_06065 [Bacteroidetes bacterium]|nr:MAG: hypothetical protein D6799_06065 [Bacteroidota bacterium]
MENIQYVGEHLWAGQWGHFLTALLFASSLMSSVSYFLSVRNNSLIRLSRGFLFMHLLSVVGIFLLMLWMLFHHYFEYQYVWQHSNRSMDKQFVLSCLWEGQEGSFLLWIFWQALMGVLFYKTPGKDESVVMGIYMMVQTFLATMILGIYVGDIKIGSSMFLLLREHPDFSNLPFLQNPEYLNSLDGRGLNPLLANYWMTIHPPTLFLGFASTLIPFTLALNGLIKQEYWQWQKQGIKWAFFSVLVLGAGILMGGAWAYEALSFGGFWAWDPVENSSLVPWLIITAAAHMMIVNNKKKGSYFITHFLSIAAFILVLYSTFLTRSGILGNASVHAFTDLGMQGQLLLFILFFVAVSIWAFLKDLLFRNFYAMSSALLLYFSIIKGYHRLFLGIWMILSLAVMIYAYVRYYYEKEEEDWSSREFWMFAGSLLLFVAGVIIIYFTSVPVLNKLFNLNKAPIKPEDYNAWMIPFASLIFLITGFSQYLKYNKTDIKSLKKMLMMDFGISSVLSFLLSATIYFFSGDLSFYQKVSYFVLILFSLYSVIANFNYWLRVSKMHSGKIPAMLSHIGFALLILGALISTSKKTEIVPTNTPAMVNQLGESFDKRKSIVLVQNDTVQAGNYFIQFEGREKKGYTYYFKVNYFGREKDGKLKHLFTLYPRVQDNPIMGKAADPDTKHFLLYDIYTHITYADLSDDNAKNMNVSQPVNYKGHLHDTIVTNKAFVILDSLYADKSYEEFMKNQNELQITVRLKVMDVTGDYHYVYPKYIIKNKTVVPITAKSEKVGMQFTIWKLYPDTEEIEIAVVEQQPTKDFIVMEASIFPMINLLWLGCIVMSAGVLVYLIQKNKMIQSR